jgi:hypothetical protein
MAQPTPFRKTTTNNPLADQLPHNNEAERAILGTILLDNKAIESAAKHVKPSDFFLPQHNTIFTAMIALDVAGSPIDTVSLMEQLNSAGALDQAGGVPYLSQLPDGLMRSTNVQHYAAIVAEKARLRQIIYAAQALQDRALAQGASVKDITADMASYAKHAGNGHAPALVSVDFHEFLRMELPPRDFVIEPLLAAREHGMIYSPRGAGKTWMTLKIAFDVASGNPDCFMWYIPKARPVVYVDGEMALEELQDRERAIARMAEANSMAYPAEKFLRIIARDMQKEMRPRINTREGRARIGECVDPGELLILDNLASLGQSSDEKETEDWAAIQDWISDLCWNGISVIMIHHAGKSGTQRGSSKREDLLSFVLNLKLPSDYSAEQGLRLEVINEKKRGKIRKPQFVQPFEVTLSVNAANGQQEWLMRPLRELLKQRAFEMLKEGMKPYDVARDTGLHPRSVYRIWNTIKAGATSLAEAD